MNSPSATAGFAAVDHTADLAFELWGPTEVALLEQGARALIVEMTEGAQVPDPLRRTVEIEAFDSEERLVRWLNEVIYWASVDSFVVARVELEIVEGVLRGTAWGVCDRALLRGEIKAATYHDLRVEHLDDRVRTLVVLDV